MSPFFYNQALNIILLISNGLLLIIPLFYGDLRKAYTTYDKKGKVVKIDKKGLNSRGVTLVAVFFLSLIGGIFKIVLESKTQKELSDTHDAIKRNEKSLLDTVGVLKDSLKLYYAHLNKSIELLDKDSIAFNKVELSLKEKGFFINKDFQVLPVSNTTNTTVNAPVGVFVAGGQNNIRGVTTQIIGTGKHPKLNVHIDSAWGRKLKP